MKSPNTSSSLALIDELIVAIPSQLDTLLDIRLSLMGKAEPGTCVLGYFKLTKALSGWHREQLESLRALLESHIQLEIVIEESNLRRRECLSLGNTPDITDYCEQQMKKAAQSNKLAKRIYLGFCWSAE